MTRGKYLEALGFTVLRFENRFVFQEPEINQPPRPGKQNGKHFKISNPGHPSLKKGGETCLFINQSKSVFFYIKIFLKLMAIPFSVGVKS